MRKERVSQQMKRELALLLQREVHDPRIGFLTITRVDLSSDLRNAKIYLTIFDESRKERNKTFRGLNSSKSYIAGELTRRMHLRYAPFLSFIEDKEQLDSFKINKILQKIESQKIDTEKV